MYVYRIEFRDDTPDEVFNHGGQALADRIDELSGRYIGRYIVGNRLSRHDRAYVSANGKRPSFLIKRVRP